MSKPEWQLAQATAPIFAFGCSSLKVSDTADLIFVKPWVGPYGDVCPDFYQDQRGFVIHKDLVQILPQVNA